MDLQQLSEMISKLIKAQYDTTLCVVVKPGESEKQACDNESCPVWLTWANYEGCILRMAMASLEDISNGGEGFDFSELALEKRERLASL